MSDLIDRGAAVVAVKCGALSARTIYGRSEEGMAALKATVTAIKELPTVDAVEVVRCKDCKYWDMVDLHFHKNICSKLMRPCDESNFCSWAERRQDG